VLIAGSGASRKSPAMSEHICLLLCPCPVVGSATTSSCETLGSDFLDPSLNVLESYPASQNGASRKEEGVPTGCCFTQLPALRARKPWHTRAHSAVSTAAGTYIPVSCSPDSRVPVSWPEENKNSQFIVINNWKSEQDV